MLLEPGEERRWKRNGPTPGLALRWTQDQSTVSKLLLLLLNNQFAVKDVHVPAFKPEQFSKSQSAKAGEEHRGSGMEEARRLRQPIPAQLSRLGVPPNVPRQPDRYGRDCVRSIRRLPRWQESPVGGDNTSRPCSDPLLSSTLRAKRG
jgi:hypothetical protein